jgi:putative DNA primase/helicase
MAAGGAAFEAKFASWSRILSLSKDPQDKLHNFKAAISDGVDLVNRGQAERGPMVELLLDLGTAHGLEPAGIEVLIAEAFEKPPPPQRIPPKWMRKDWLATLGIMTELWIEHLQEQGEIDFCVVGSQWHVYDNGIWREDETHRRGASIHEFRKLVGKDKAPKIRAVLDGQGMWVGMQQLAACLLAKPVAAFDQHKQLVAFPKNCFDAERDCFVEHNKEHYISRCCAIDPTDTPTPLWDKIFKQIVPDEATRQYLIRYWGYCLTGYTNEQCFIFLHGPGQAGKSTLLETIMKILGSYATPASINLLTRTAKHERHPEEIAVLRGRRFVVADETDKGVNWDEAKLKHMVSGELLRARFMRENSFEFRPECKIALSGNDKPTIDDTGKAMSRRIHLILIDFAIRDEDKIADLKEKLEAEWPGILWKLLQGMRQWKLFGLNPPKRVTDATAEYLEEEDAIGMWLEEKHVVYYKQDANGNLLLDSNGRRVIDEQNYKASTKELFNDWSRWADEAGEPRGNKKQLTRTLKAKGFKYFHSGSFRGFLGLWVQLVRQARDDDRYHYANQSCA